MKLKFGQHIYGRKKEKGFSTLGYSHDVTPDDLKSIEKNCNYELPTSLYCDEIIEKPIKYVFYKLNEEKVILGRGIYTGLDELRRVGNYVFHNLIFQVSDMTSLGVNPVNLIRYLDSMGVFVTEAPINETLKCIEVDLAKDDNVFFPNYELLSKNKDRLPTLVYIFDSKSIEEPIIIEYEKKDEIFDLLYDLFVITPKWQWKELSFNTLWYKDYKFLIRGIKKGFPLSHNYSIKIDSQGEVYELKVPIQDEVRYEYAKLAVQKALGDKQGLSNLYLLQEMAETTNWIKFIELYKDSQQDIKEVIYGKNRESILAEISQGNTGLYSVLKGYINEEDYIKAFKSKRFIDRFIEQRDEIIARDFVEWFYKTPISDNKKKFYIIFLRDSWILDFLFNKIREEKMRIIENIEIMQALIEFVQDEYSDQGMGNDVIEKRLFKVFCELLENKPNIDMSVTLKVVKKIPPSNDLELLILKALLRYRLGDSSELISLIKEKLYQPLLFELLNNGMNTTDWEKHKRTFQQNEPKSSILKKLWK